MKDIIILGLSHIEVTAECFLNNIKEGATCTAW